MKKKILITLACILAVPVLGIVALGRDPGTVRRAASRSRAGGGGDRGRRRIAWIVKTPHGAVLVDAGLDTTGAAILAELKSQGVGRLNR